MRAPQPKSGLQHPTPPLEATSGPPSERWPMRCRAPSLVETASKQGRQKLTRTERTRLLTLDDEAETD